jgi:hypothetical protein
MNSLSLYKTLAILYTFYNKKLANLTDNKGKRTEEQEYFIKHTSLFWEGNFEKWNFSMQKIAKKTNIKFWDTTHYNRQSFSCYFIFNESEKTLVKISSLYNIYYIDDDKNINIPFINLIVREINVLFPSYFKVNEDDLMIDLNPYFECYVDMNFRHFNLFEAFLGYKPSL